MYPYLFEQKWLPSYIVFICIGIAAAFLCCKIVADKTDVSYEVFSALCIMFLISLLTGFASARLFQMLYNFIETGKVGTGITFLGGLIGGVVTFALMYFIMRKKLCAWQCLRFPWRTLSDESDAFWPVVVTASSPTDSLP